MAVFQLPEPVNVLAAIGAGRKMRQENKLRELYAGADFGTPEGLQKTAAEAMKIDPEAGLRFMDVWERMDERNRQEALALKKEATRLALQIEAAPLERRPALWAEAQGMYRDRPELFKGDYAPGAEQAIIMQGQEIDQLLADRQKRAEAAMEPPKTREVTRGGMTVTEEWNPQTRTWTKIGEGSRFAPDRPPAPPARPEKLRILDEMGIDPKSDEGKKLLERTFMGGDTAPSAFSEKRAYWEDIYKSAGDPDWKNKAGIAAQSSNADSIPEIERPLALPEDPDALESGKFYTLADGTVGRWNGTAFEVVE